MKITNQGHLWVGVEHKGIEYILTYNHGIDATTIYREVDITKDDEYGANLYVDYFHGGFDCQTELPYDDLLKDAETYIEMYLKDNVEVKNWPVFKALLNECVNNALDKGGDYEDMPELSVRIAGIHYNLGYNADLHDNLIKLIDDEIKNDLR